MPELKIKASFHTLYALFLTFSLTSLWGDGPTVAGIFSIGIVSKGRGGAHLFVFIFNSQNLLSHPHPADFLSDLSYQNCHSCLTWSISSKGNRTTAMGSHSPNVPHGERMLLLKSLGEGKPGWHVPASKDTGPWMQAQQLVLSAIVAHNKNLVLGILKYGLNIWNYKSLGLALPLEF